MPDELFCPPCKVVENGLGLKGEIEAFYGFVEALHERGLDLTDAMWEEAKQIFCPAHEAAQEFNRRVTQGPFVKFKRME